MYHKDIWEQNKEMRNIHGNSFENNMIVPVDIMAICLDLSPPRKFYIFDFV